MSDIFQIASIGMAQGQQRLETISLNAANATTTGYRRQVATGVAFDSMLAQPDETSGSVAKNLIDLRAGGITTTPRALDVAIEADDLFFALTDGTNTWLTRDGSFRVDESGVLRGERGLSVLGAEGELRLPGSDVQIAADGRITHRGVVVGTLQLFRPINKSSLESSGGVLLAAPEGIVPAESLDNRVRSGALEASNTDAGREMMQLMMLSRQFESLSRVVQSYDDLLGRTIQKLGDR